MLLGNITFNLSRTCKTSARCVKCFIQKWKYCCDTNSSQVIVLTLYWVLTDKNPFLGMSVAQSGAVLPHSASAGKDTGRPKSAISPWQLSTWCGKITELSNFSVFCLLPPTPNGWDYKSLWTVVLPKPKIKFKNSAVERVAAAQAGFSDNNCLKINAHQILSLLEKREPADYVVTGKYFTMKRCFLPFILRESAFLTSIVFYNRTLESSFQSPTECTRSRPLRAAPVLVGPGK